MTRGFVTIATGDIKYYKMAHTLLLSYKYHTSNYFPFAIIAEEENEYTKEFDKVILTSEASHSFMDKLLLLKLKAWDESIFFDADTLAFGDLNDYWEVFKNATDFSSIGVNVALNEGGAFYDIEGIGKYGTKVSYKTRIHLGVAFIRNTIRLQKLYEDSIDIYKNYNKLSIHTNPQCYDEVILGIAMPMNNMRAEPEQAHMMACFPCLTSLSGDMKSGKLSYTTNWDTSVKGNGLLVHFGNVNTIHPLYRYSEEWLNNRLRIANHESFRDVVLYKVELKRFIINIQYMFYQVPIFVKRGVSFFRKRNPFRGTASSLLE